jgi:BirA family transcriptional regulator, biotin operon repressor / biotin---[acetyl-CoA-carboxylase] ligase
MRFLRKHLKTVDSTNTFAKTNLLTFDPTIVTVVTSDEQTAGRGRLGRTWKSSLPKQDVITTFAFQVPKSSLTYSYLLSPLLSVIAARVLSKFKVQAQIKWPNDIIVNFKYKVGGILCELEVVNNQYWAILGIGINVNSTVTELDIPNRPIWPVSTLKHEYSQEFSVSDITESLCNDFSNSLDDFFSTGFHSFQKEYQNASLLLHKVIKFTENNVTITGRAVSIGEDGMLYIELTEGPNKGTTKGYLAGDVSGVEIVEGELISSESCN